MTGALLERTHVAKTPDPIVLYGRQQKGPGYKPLGFWYEVDGDWRRWCTEDGQSVWVDGHFLHRLNLGDERMLYLRSPLDLVSFTDAYGIARPPVAGRMDDIDWPRVALEYDGIEIAPYIWSQRLELFWYYGWDCASGCIWQPRGASLTIESPEPLAVTA